MIAFKGFRTTWLTHFTNMKLLSKSALTYLSDLNPKSNNLCSKGNVRSGFDAEDHSSLVYRACGRRKDVLPPPVRPGNEAKGGSGEDNFRQWS